jgi:hypothetical protein
MLMKKKNAGSQSKLPPQLWLVDFIMQQNVCQLGHNSQRCDQFLQALYAFHKGHWYFIPSIIWNQIYKFWDWVLARRATTTKSWGLPFPFLLTYILKKKGIKGTPRRWTCHRASIFWQKPMEPQPITYAKRR